MSEKLPISLYVENKQWVALVGDGPKHSKSIYGIGVSARHALSSLCEQQKFQEFVERVKPQACAKVFKVFRVSKNTNSFGLHGHWLIAQDGETWEVAKYRYPGSTDDNWNLGRLILVQPAASGIIGEWDWAGLGVEIPERKYPNPPPDTVEEVWSESWLRKATTKRSV